MMTREKNCNGLITGRIEGEVMARLIRYQHDCTDCQFLGHIVVPCPLSNGEAPFKHCDLYYCKMADSFMGGSILARFSSRPSEYASYAVKLIRDHYLGISWPPLNRSAMSTSCPAIIAGFYFAVAKGLITR